MIDGIKAILSNNLNEIRSNPLLNFELTNKVSVHTGEVKTGKFPVAKYKGLTFIDKESIIEIKGSIHVYNNNGKHNYNSFGLSDIHLVLFELTDKLFILINNAELKNIEFGVNLDVDFNPGDFLNSIIFHKSKMFTLRIENNMHYRECAHSQYYIKIYDKGLQNDLNKYILRYELKFIKMEKINAFGIKYLSDLLDPNKLHLLHQELLRVYDEILIGDIKAEPRGLSTKDLLLFTKGHNANYWASNLPRKVPQADETKAKAYRANKTSYYRRIVRFRNLLSETRTDEKQKHVRALIDVKCNSLLTIAQKELTTPKKCVKLTNESDLTYRKNVCQIDQAEHLEEMYQIAPLFYSDNDPNISIRSTSHCMVTGVDISMQKQDSRFLCTSGIKYYMEHNPEIWTQLRSRLSPKWKDSSLKKQIQEIHHSIRNEYFNKIHNTRKSIEKVISHPSLFNQFDLISSEKLIDARYLT